MNKAAFYQAFKIFNYVASFLPSVGESVFTCVKAQSHVRLCTQYSPPRARRAPTIDGRRGVPEVSAACRVCVDVCLSHVCHRVPRTVDGPVKYHYLYTSAAYCLTVK